MSTNADYSSVPHNTPADDGIPGYDVRVWAPVDTKAGHGERIMPAYEKTIGYKAPYPPTFNGDTDHWGMRPAAGIEIIDVDHYDEKTGADTIDELERELGELPPTVKVTARGPNDPGGKYLYRVPADWWGSDRKHVEFLKRRFCAMGEHVKTHKPVKIYDEYLEEIELSDVRLEDIPQLPETWLEALSKPAGAASTSTPDDAPESAPNPYARPTAPDNGIGSRTGSDDYNGGLLGYAKDLREAGAGTDWIFEELRRVARSDGDLWTDSDLDTLANEAVKTKAVDPYVSQFRGVSTADTPSTTPDTPPAVISPPSSTWLDDSLDEDIFSLPKPLPPNLLTRDDGVKILYRNNKHTLIIGRRGQGKSMLAAMAAAEVLRENKSVLWVDFEDDREGLAEKLELFGIRHHMGHALKVRSNVPKAADTATAGIKAAGTALIVIDSYSGLIRALKTAENSNDNDGIDAMFDAWLKPVQQTAPVIILDHVAKDSKGELSARGGGRKEDLAHHVYSVAQVAQFSDNQDGYAQVTCTKDRNHHWAEGQVVGFITAKSGKITLRAEAADPTLADFSAQMSPVTKRELAIVKMAGEGSYGKTELSEKLAEAYGDSGDKDVAIAAKTWRTHINTVIARKGSVLLVSCDKIHVAIPVAPRVDGTKEEDKKEIARKLNDDGGE